LKLTLDSTEPLQDAMRVLGALYGVTLIVSSDEQDAREPAKSRSRRSPARKARTDAPAAEANAGKSKRKAALRLPVPPSNAEVRSWARHNGFTVSDRGRLPTSVMTAYRNAHHD
jgi:hypothetical protein